MALCPECGGTLSARGSCNSCGLRAPSDVDGCRRDHNGYRLCVHDDRGMLCARVGRFALLGGPDRWYCEAHFPNLCSSGGGKDPPAGGFRAIHALLKPIDKEAAEERAAIQAGA